MALTLAEKVWRDHLVRSADGEPDLLYIDLHLLHEVTSAQAFDGLRLAGRKVRRPDLTIATEDHNTPTIDIDKPIADLVSRAQIDALRNNSAEFGIRLHSLGDADQGIVHVVGPQLGLTQPGMTVVCGDSHTSTHGAFGALAFGIGTSEVEHVLATQTLPLKKFKTMAITVNGKLKPGVTSKDIILAVIAKIGTGGGQGYVLEYRGEAIRALSMEGRMTVCNMSIEDLRASAEILKGKKISSTLRMLVVPGSAKVRLQAEAEGLDKVFLDAGAEWRQAGCSMCLGMNPDQLAVGERSASTSNRNFEGRQGKGGRTHLVSPLVAAATALRGTLSSPADLDSAKVGA